MKDALSYIIDKWDLRYTPKSWMPILIPNTTRRHLSLLFEELGFRLGAEIGVNKGSNALRFNRANPECKLYCIDPWALYDGMNDFTDDAERKDAYALAKQKLDPIDNIEIIRESSMDALRHFEDESFDFVYIDANHEWPYVTQDIFYWAQKVRKGGIVSGHDYLTNPKASEFNQVTEVVHGYTNAFNIRRWFVLDDAEFPKRPGTWFWVKT